MPHSSYCDNFFKKTEQPTESLLTSWYTRHDNNFRALSSSCFVHSSTCLAKLACTLCGGAHNWLESERESVRERLSIGKSNRIGGPFFGLKPHTRALENRLMAAEDEKSNPNNFRYLRSLAPATQECDFKELYKSHYQFLTNSSKGFLWDDPFK